MTPEQRKLVLLAKARSLSTEGQSTGAADQEQETVFSGLGTAFKANVDPILEGMGTTAEVLGGPEWLSQGLKNATSLPENFKSSSEAFMNEDKDGSLAWRHLPGAIGEQLGQFTGSIAARGLGVAGGAAVGSLAGPAGAAAGATAGAFAGPMAFQVMQQLGPVAEARAKNDGRTEVNQDDLLAALATTSASGALDAIAPGAEGFIKRMILEGGTEGTQSLIEQTGESVGTKAGLQVSPKQALGEGIIGAGSAGVVDASIAATQKAASVTGDVAQNASDRIRYDNREFSDDEKRAASALARAADGNMDILGNVDDEGQGTAKGAANAALRELRARSEEHSKDLRKLISAFPEDSFEARAALKALNKIDQHQGSPLPKSYAEDLRESMGRLDPKYADLPEVENLISLSNQINVVQDYTSKSDRDMGGLGKLTKQLDILDKRNTTKLGAYALLAGHAAAGPLGIGTAAAHIAGMRALNKSTQLIDRLTNRRSKVKRFVESVQRDGRSVPDLRPDAALQALVDLKKKRAAEAAAQKLAIDAAIAKANGTDQTNPNGPLNQSKAPTKAELAEQAKADRNASLYKLNAEATLPVFESGKIPDHPMFNTYRFMKEQTNLGPEDALGIIEQLEREGAVPKGTAQKFVEEPMAFADDQEWTMGLQQAVKARANPGFDAKAEAKAKAPKPPADPDRVLRKFQGATATAKNRYEHKRLQGQVAGVQLDEDIREALPGISAEQHQNLLDLRQSIDAPDMTRAQRFKLVNEYLPMIFPRKNQKAVVEAWKKKFNSLAAAGNDEEYHRQIVEQEEQKDEALDKAIAQAVERKKRVKKSAAKKKQPDTDRSQPQTPEDRALERLAQPVEKPQTPEEKALEKYQEAIQETPEKEPEVTNTPATQAAEDAEPTVEETKRLLGKEPKKTKDPEKLKTKLEELGETKVKSSLEQRTLDRVKYLENVAELAELGADFLDQYRAALPSSVDGRVEDLFYQFADEGITENMLIDAFASKYDVPPEAAAQMVSGSISNMETQGTLSRVLHTGASKLKYDDKFVTDEEGNDLFAVNFKFHDEDFRDRMAIAKAINSVSRMVNQDGSDVIYQPGQLKDGAFKALKDIPDERVNETFKPLLDFIQAMRDQKLSVNGTMLQTIVNALGGVGKDKRGTIRQVLEPKNKFNQIDKGPLNTVAQLLFQLGEEGGLLRQEWGAGANGRVYSKNGLAHTQAGDLMKGILRCPEKHSFGGEAGLRFTLHGIGNLLGFDKKSPAERRASIFQKAPGKKGTTIAEELYAFAEDPFAQTKLKNSKGQLTPMGKIMKDGEGFFQVLNAAMELKAMVDFAKARHPDKARMKAHELLQDTKVQEDLAQNYETDFIVQLDANNNAYQIAGMVMGYEDVLRATGLLPPVGAEGDPDARQGADIYMKPALAIADRIPELAALLSGPKPKLADSKLRKLFKKAIGTYLYAAEFNSRKASFAEVLEDIAGDGELFGISEGDGLITVPQNIVQGMQSPEGFMFETVKYNVHGMEKERVKTRKRLVSKEVERKQKDGTKKTVTVWGVESASGLKGKFSGGGKTFESAEDAIKHAYGMDVYVRMNDELIRDMNTRFPDMRKYLKFAEAVSEIVKKEGNTSVQVPTKDGMVLEYSFRMDPVFTGHEVTLGGGNVVKLGIKTEDTKIGGRGLAAFMTHQNDAWSLRETYKRLPDLKAFNPIHDSYGFHPSDAAKGQETWVQVMQELGSPDYNLFLEILDANKISLETYLAYFKTPEAKAEAKDFILGRRGVAPVEARQIPTSLS